LSDDKKCGNLLAIHLSDLGINKDYLLSEDVQEFFGIFPEKQGGRFYNAIKKLL